MARGRKAAYVGNPKLPAAREKRGWTDDDAAVALQALALELGEPEPAVSGAQVSKWERGARKPGRYYRPRLCLLFEATPAELGFPATPRLMKDIGPAPVEAADHAPRKRLPADHWAIATVIGRRRRSPDPEGQRLDLHETDLSGFRWAEARPGGG
jgi:transcriptional regulator with XRE-family HTH domain